MVLMLNGNSEICAHKNWSLLLDLAFDYIESIHKSYKSEKNLFSFMCAQHVLSYHHIYDVACFEMRYIEV